MPASQQFLNGFNLMNFQLNITTKQFCYDLISQQVNKTNKLYSMNTNIQMASNKLMTNAVEISSCEDTVMAEVVSQPHTLHLMA